MNRVEFGRMYKEITGAKSCPRSVTQKFADRLGEDQKRIQYADLVAMVNDGTFPQMGKEAGRMSSESIMEYLNENRESLETRILNFDQYREQDHVKEMSDFTHRERCEMEKEVYSFYFTHPLDNYQREGFQISDVTENRIIGRVEAMVSNIRQGLTKNGKPYYIVTLEDEYDQVSVIIWGDQYEMWRNALYEGSAIKLDIMPHPKFSTWNLTRMCEIVKLRTFEQPTEEEERETRSEDRFDDFIKSLEESNAGTKG